MSEAGKLDIMDKIVRLATEMLDGEMDLIEGCHVMSNLSASLCNEQTPYPDERFFTFIAVASDTDQFPLGSSRKHYNKRYLMKLDEERRDYLKQARPDIIEACEEIIKDFSKKE